MSEPALTPADLVRLRDVLRQANTLTRSLLGAVGAVELSRMAVSAGSVLGDGPAVLLAFDSGAGRLVVDEVEGVDRKIASAFSFETTVGFAGEVWQRAARGEDPHQLRQALQASLGFRAPVIEPLGTPAQLRGLWAVDARAEGPLGELLAASLRQFGASVAAAFASVEARAPSGRAALLDPLTGLYDRHFVEGHLARELARAKRYREPLSVVLIDMDHFDEVNERHGYACGDRVLKQVATLLVGQQNSGQDSGLALCYRETDVAARYGPDSFLVLLPATPSAGAHHAAERFLEGLRHQRFTASADGPHLASVTATAAVVTFPDDGATPGELVVLAESLAGSAAGAGGDKVVVPAPRMREVAR